MNEDRPNMKDGTWLDAEWNNYSKEESIMRCARCGEDYTHQISTETYDRRREDDEHGTHVTVGAGQVRVDQDITGNPSDRRHGIKLRFDCENCSAITVITFAQHKGFTLVTYGEEPIPATAN